MKREDCAFIDNAATDSGENIHATLRNMTSGAPLPIYSDFVSLVG
jgi:hypothetical protein